MGEVKLTVTIPNGEDPGLGHLPDTSRMEASGLFPESLKPHAKFKFTGPHEAELTLTEDNGAAYLFAQKFLAMKEGYLYDFDDDPYNGENEVVVNKPITNEQINKIIAELKRGGEAIKDKYTYFTNAGSLSDSQWLAFNASGLYEKFMKPGITFAEAAARLKSFFPKKLKDPLAIVYLDGNDDTETLGDLYWLPQTTFNTYAEKLTSLQKPASGVRLSGTAVPAAATAPTNLSESFPPITQDAIDHPTRYLVYPLLKDKEGEIAIEANKPVKDISAYSPDMAKFFIPTEEEVLAYYRKFLSDGFEHPGGRYPIERDFIQVENNIPFLVIPRMDQMCLPSVNKVDQTTAINGAFFNLDFTLTHDQFDEFTELMRLLPGDACVYERDAKGGHKIRLRVDEARGKQAVDVLNEVIRLKESNKEPKGPEGNDLSDYEARVYAAYTLFKDNDVSAVEGLRDQIALIIEETARLSGSNVIKDNKEFITETRWTSAILILVITLSSIPAIYTAAAMMGFETPWGRRKRYQKMVPDLVEEYRRKHKAGQHPGRTIIGRTEETRAFLTYLASMKIGMGDPTGGAVEAKGGTGKDFLFHAAAQALATGKYSDGTPVEPWLLEKVKKIRVFDPDVVIEGSSWKGVKERKFRSLMKTAEEESRGGDLKGEFVGGTFFITNEAADKSQKGADGMTGDVSVMKDVKEPVGNGTFPHILVFATEDRDRVYRTSGGQIDAQQLRRYPQIFPSGFEDQAPKEVAVILFDILVKSAREKGWVLPDNIEESWPANPWEPPTLEDLEKISKENPLRQVCEELAEESRIYLPYQGNPSRSVQLMYEWIREALVSQMAGEGAEAISITSLRGYLRQRGSSEAKGLIQKIHLTMASIMDSQRLSIDSLREQLEDPELLNREHVLNFASGLEPQEGETDQNYLNRLRGLIKFLDGINPRKASGIDARGEVTYDARALSQEEMATLNKQLIAIYLKGTEVVNTSGELQVNLSEIHLRDAHSGSGEVPNRSQPNAPSPPEEKGKRRRGRTRRTVPTTDKFHSPVGADPSVRPPVSTSAPAAPMPNASPSPEGAGTEERLQEVLERMVTKGIISETSKKDLLNKLGHETAAEVGERYQHLLRAFTYYDQVFSGDDTSAKDAVLSQIIRIVTDKKVPDDILKTLPTPDDNPEPPATPPQGGGQGSQRLTYKATPKAKRTGAAPKASGGKKTTRGVAGEGSDHAKAADNSARGAERPIQTYYDLRVRLGLLGASYELARKGNLAQTLLSKIALLDPAAQTPFAEISLRLHVLAEELSQHRVSFVEAVQITEGYLRANLGKSGQGGMINEAAIKAYVAEQVVMRKRSAPHTVAEDHVHTARGAEREDPRFEGLRRAGEQIRRK